jgi:N6-L-threonylcarbamoyladenine synthase
MSTVKILAIESSCDETAIAILGSDGARFELLANEISSQVKLHAQFGGVVPNLAAREHVKNIVPLFERALEKASVSKDEISAIAVTNGPGLIPALLVGVNFAKTLCYLWEKPLIGIHHIEGHIYANLLNEDIQFPALCLVVSGGHTQLVYMRDHFQYEIIGQTLDDAAGEAFDKVARILNVGYPGGPIVSSRAENFQTNQTGFSIKLPRPMLNKAGFDFSFSGLKTAVLYETKKNSEHIQDENYINEVCHEFQQAVIDVLVNKTIKASKKLQPKTIMLAGGVSANKELREQLGKAINNELTDTKYCIPELSLTGDNAAMIAVAAALRWQKSTKDQQNAAKENWKTIQAQANLKLS